ncbi:MAG: CHAT domain-containing protein [Deltaproteobacteria bacterium]|nr:CHAT domain-containing protein [Deltaproteobacteria bacterium]
MLVLPGILGSELSDTQRSGYGLIWLDPLGLVAGQLAQLQLTADGRSDANPRVHISASGIFDSYYGDLIEALHERGFDARAHCFDWRRDIRESAAVLANTIEALPPERPVSLVAHSMGGLVSRRMFQAHPAAAARVSRLIMLGTPNFGSFKPVLVLTGEEGLFQWVARLDLANSAATLTAVFRSFPGLLQMLPNQAKAAIDFFAGNTWGNAAPAAAALVRARKFQEQLADDASTRARYTLIAGYGQDTVTEIRLRRPGRFEFRSSEAGDGTVPLDLCLLDGVERTYFTATEHGSLPSEPEVIEATCAALEGRAVALPPALPLSRARAVTRPYTAPALPAVPAFIAARRGRAAPPPAPSPAAQIEAARRLRQELTRATTAAQRAALQRATAAVLQPFLRQAPARTPERAAPPPPAVARRARRLLIKTACGSVTEAPSYALVLGVFPGVRPQSSLAALDAKVDGYVTQLFHQGAIHGGAGELLFLPVPGAAIPAELAVLAGLGEARYFNAAVLRQVGENLARALHQVHVTDFATVPIGAGTSLRLEHSLQFLLEGFLIGLDAVDTDGLFRAMTLCEANPRRYRELYRLVAEAVPYWAARGVEIEHKELPQLAPPPQQAPGRGYNELSYWIEAAPGGLRYFLMGAAAIPTKQTAVNPQTLGREVQQLKDAMESRGPDAPKVAALQRFGKRLEAVFPRQLAKPLYDRDGFTQATLNLEPAAASVPWELLPAGQQPIALRMAVARRLAIAADHRPANTYLLPGSRPRRLRVAIVGNPTDNLPAAAREAQQLARLLRRDARFEVHTFIGRAECSEGRVSALMQAGAVDILHYAGHGEYDLERPERSGLVLPGEADGMLTAREVRGYERPPLLIFANACQVGIVGLRQSYGFAEALLQAGVRAYVGTFWSIPDLEAVSFALAFYQAVAAGTGLGDALLAARRATRRAGGKGAWAWASYMLYGPAWLQLAEKRA